MPKMTLNISLHGTNLLRNFLPSRLLIININIQLIFFALQKLIVMRNVFINSYQFSIMPEKTLNISLHGSNCNTIVRSNCNKIVRHFPCL